MIAVVWDAVSYRPVDMYVPTFRRYFYQDTRCHIEKKAIYLAFFLITPHFIG